MLYSGLGSAIAHLIGRPLIRLNNRQEAVEADFRFSPRLREEAEGIALYGGEACLRATLGAVSFDLDHRRRLVAAALLHTGAHLSHPGLCNRGKIMDKDRVAGSAKQIKGAVKQSQAGGRQGRR
jgi:hypothetical protein